MLVGDPDQCIMEFAGARPELFDEFEKMPGAVSISLTGCHRSSSHIAQIAKHLQRGSKGYDGLRVTDKESQALLSTHTFGSRSSDLRMVVEAFRAFIGDATLDGTGAAVLAWSGSVVARLSGTTPTLCPLEGPKWRTLLHGVSVYYMGDVLEFFESVEKVLSICIWNSPRPTDDQVQAMGATRSGWKRLVWNLALNSCLPRGDESLEQWSRQVQNDFERTGQEVLKCETISWGRKLPIRVEHGQNRDQVLLKPVTSYAGRAVNTESQSILVEKVHQVKGREFDAVCLFVPKPDSRGLGALDNWFGHVDKIGQTKSESPDAGEARRVAYVAMTRAKRKLMVVIPTAWYEELCTTPHGSSLVAAFGGAAPVSIESLLLRHSANPQGDENCEEDPHADADSPSRRLHKSESTAL
jgi:hypothetical protein